MPTVMEIVRAERQGCPELVISGRLDNYWSRHLAEAIDELMREGRHHARLNLSNTSYVSSAGIRVLLQAFQQFAGVGGTLVVTEPSPTVRQILDVAGLGGMLCEETVERKPPGEPAMWTREADNCTFEAYQCAPGERLVCKVSGHPERLRSEGFGESDCLVMPMPRDTIALGLGAFGDSYGDCRGRFGEFIAAAGCAACQPTEETGCADYLLSVGSMPPRIAALYSLSCKGKFETFLRFDCRPNSGPAGLTGILETSMQTGELAAAAILIIAECSGVMGASLKRSPTGPHQSLFHHPEVRQWLSFSPVRSYTRSVVLAAGVAARPPYPPALVPLLRPVHRNSGLMAHLHGAVFGYRPLRKGYIELEPAVERLFDSGSLQCVLHLLADDRAGDGGGQTEFTRGACWIGPISQIVSLEDRL